MPIRPLSLFGLFLPALAPAQDFRLEDYEPAPFHRHYLSVAPGLNWTSSGYRQERDSSDTESGNGYGNPSLAFAYGSRAWDPSREWKLGSAFRLGREGSESRSTYTSASEFAEPRLDATRHVNGNGALKLSADASYRKYFRKNWFAEPAGKGFAEYSPADRNRGRSWGRQAWTPDSSAIYIRTDRTRNEHQFEEGTLAFAAGHGRIVDVGFASTGLFMLDRLAGSGAPRMRLDAQGMRELEGFIESRRKLRPFLDGRRAAIYDMASVERFLKERGGAPIPAEALLAMADEWSHPSPIPRLRGWELSVSPFLRGSWREDRRRNEGREWSGIRPAAEETDAAIDALTSGPETQSSRSRTRSFESDREYGVAAQWRFQRPWRRQFQFSLTADFRYSDTWTELGNSGTTTLNGTAESERSAFLKRRFYAAEWDAGGSAAWIPQSRFWMRASLKGHADWKGNQGLGWDSYFDGNSARGSSAQVALQCGYEVAPRLALLGYAAWDGYRSDGYRQELDYFLAGYRFDHGVYSNSAWHAELNLTYYLF